MPNLLRISFTNSCNSSSLSFSNCILKNSLKDSAIICRLLSLISLIFYIFTPILDKYSSNSSTSFSMGSIGFISFISFPRSSNFIFFLIFLNSRLFRIYILFIHSEVLQVICQMILLVGILFSTIFLILDPILEDQQDQNF